MPQPRSLLIESYVEEARRHREETLHHAERSDDPTIAEFAKEIRRGNVSFRDALRIPAYSEAMAKEAGRWTTAIDRMIEQETEAHRGAGQTDETTTRSERHDTRVPNEHTPDTPRYDSDWDDDMSEQTWLR